jgi:L-lactate dehydrogenase complex protein LldG
MGRESQAAMNATSRDAILARVKAALGDDTVRTSSQELAQRMLTPPIAARPHVDDDYVAAFMAKARSNLFSVEQIASMQLLVPAVRAFLAEANLAPDFSIAPALAHLDWPRDWQIHVGAGRKVEHLSVTLAQVGIAETGSVIFRSASDRPTTLNFLPDIHVAVLRWSDIVRYPEDAWALFKAEDWPRTVNFVAGPSRTADVGGTIVRPAHGPKAVHLILVEN